MKHNIGFTWLVLITGCAFCYGCGTPEADTTSNATAVDEHATDENNQSESEKQMDDMKEMMELEQQIVEEQMMMNANVPRRNELIVESHSGLKPASFFGGPIIELSGDNTSVEFLGTKPDGEKHAGGFGYVEGKVTFSHPENELKNVTITIVTKSLWSDDPKLTAHLKSPDFFNVNEHPDMTFKSTSVTDEGDGKFEIKGDLTMLGVTKEISMPVQIGVAGDGATLTSEFKVDRTEFGMNYGEGKIDAEVGLTVVVGKEGGPPAADARADTPQ